MSQCQLCVVHTPLLTSFPTRDRRHRHRGRIIVGLGSDKRNRRAYRRQYPRVPRAECIRDALCDLATGGLRFRRTSFQTKRDYCVCRRLGDSAHIRVRQVK